MHLISGQSLLDAGEAMKQLSDVKDALVSATVAVMHVYSTDVYCIPLVSLQCTL